MNLSFDQSMIGYFRVRTPHVVAWLGFKNVCWLFSSRRPVVLSRRSSFFYNKKAGRHDISNNDKSDVKDQQWLNQLFYILNDSYIDHSFVKQESIYLNLNLTLWFFFPESYNDESGCDFNMCRWTKILIFYNIGISRKVEATWFSTCIYYFSWKLKKKYTS